MDGAIIKKFNFSRKRRGRPEEYEVKTGGSV